MDRSIHIRPARPADAAQLAGLARGYIEFYRRRQPPDERLADWLALFHERPAVGAQFVAEEDGRLLGFATVYLTYSTLALRPTAVMNDLFVVPEQRGRGIGRALIERSAAYARESDCGVLSWRTQSDNETAQLLYDRIGTRTGWVTYELPV